MGRTLFLRVTVQFNAKVYANSMHALVNRKTQSIPPVSSPIAVSSTEMLVWRFILFLRTTGLIRGRKKKMHCIHAKYIN